MENGVGWWLSGTKEGGSGCDEEGQMSNGGDGLCLECVRMGSERMSVLLMFLAAFHVLL